MDNKQLPAEWIDERVAKKTKYMLSHDGSYPETYIEGYSDGLQDGATEYAIKLHQAEQDNKDLKEVVSELRNSHSALNDKLISVMSERDELRAKCDSLESLLRAVHQMAKAGIFPDLPVETMGAQKCVEIDQAITEALEGEGEKEEELPFEDIKFMESCNIYPHVNNSAKVLTENDEGAYLEREDLIKLSAILYKYANQKEDKQ